MMGFKKILVPTDLSKESVAALNTAVQIAAEESGSTIYLLHVIPRVVDPAYSLDPKLLDLRCNRAEKDLVDWRKRVPKSIRCKTFLCEGSLAREIGRIAKEQSIDLLVMTTRGRHGLSRIIHPNASEETVRLAPCPVLVLPVRQNKKG